MRTQIETTSNPWKKKAIERRKKLSIEKEKTKRQGERLKRLEKELQELKEKNRLTKVKNYGYPLEIIWIAVIMHIHYNVSLRAVSQTLTLVGSLFGLSFGTISHVSVRNWCLKVGQYYLNAPKKSGKYVLISDESVEIDREHLLLLLLVEVGESSPIVPLEMKSVTVLNLGVQGSWKGPEIATKIQETIEPNKIDIEYGISDKGKALRKAMKDLKIDWIGDCTHEMANFIRTLFKSDKGFIDYTTNLNKVRCKWIMSKNRFYTPPEIRTKDRFQSLFVIHKWTMMILEEWDKLSDEIKKELAFIKKTKPTIKAIKQCYELIEKFSSEFKTKGIQEVSVKNWKAAIVKYKKQERLCKEAKEFIAKMNAYLKAQQEVLPEAFQILCCSDIIESIFGKYKNKRMKIITDDVLKIVAYTKDITQQDVNNAMLEIRTLHVKQWKEKNTTVSKFAVLKRQRNKKKVAA